MSTFLGISGAKRNACAAICVDGQVRAACEEERLTRIRGIGIESRGLPALALNEVLSLSRRSSDDVTAYVVAEPNVRIADQRRSVAVDHHLAHAATAFLTSPFQQAAVLVCDRHPGREISVWTGREGRLDDQHWPWHGPAFATLYAECAELFDAAGHVTPDRLEAMAHLARGERAEQLIALFRCSGDALVIDRDYRKRVRDMIESERRRRELAVETASAIQTRIGELLLELIADIRAAVKTECLCLGGGLFFNTYFTTLVRRSGMFKDVFVPINPGNSGLAVGATLQLASQNGHANAVAPVSPFLGPDFDSEAVKATLDGCKLSYSFASESEAIDAAVHALSRGQLIGWFQGRMEWGPRALGHRSILASPQSPYVLDNLNSFLRKRERWQSFGVSVCDDAVADVFCGPAASAFMEYEYGLRDAERLRHVIPPGATSIRVQTVAPDERVFWTLHKRMEQATGTGILVNTSFNGFHEPIVCTPRDAVRVFYGTGLDMLIMDRFILRK